eukprot:TRINITY_DN17337_c0_g1_i1.p2 TRINITY_DN17337_c0_g1~~TRINITY_DN17337_c0_g1_i1.p2  ORF type:complete len:432 (-),score=39.58 TRINITY_DN17337_c0_g1_i1:4-1299(-)
MFDLDGSRVYNMLDELWAQAAIELDNEASDDELTEKHPPCQLVGKPPLPTRLANSSKTALFAFGNQTAEGAQLWERYTPWEREDIAERVAQMAMGAGLAGVSIRAECRRVYLRGHLRAQEAFCKLEGIVLKSQAPAATEIARFITRRVADVEVNLRVVAPTRFPCQTPVGSCVLCFRSLPLLSQPPPAVWYVCIHCHDMSFVICDECEHGIAAGKRFGPVEQSPLLRAARDAERAQRVTHPGAVRAEDGIIPYTYRGVVYHHNSYTHFLAKVHPKASLQGVIWGPENVRTLPVSTTRAGEVLVLSETEFGCYCDRCSIPIRRVRYKCLHYVSYELCDGCEALWMLYAYDLPRDSSPVVSPPVSPIVSRAETLSFNRAITETTEVSPSFGMPGRGSFAFYPKDLLFLKIRHILEGKDIDSDVFLLESTQLPE